MILLTIYSVAATIFAVAVLAIKTAQTQIVLIETEIKDMPVNSYGYTVPWALYERHGDVYVNPDYTVRPEPGGTANTKITMRLGYVDAELPQNVVLHKNGRQGGYLVANVKTTPQKLHEETKSFSS